MRKLAGETYAIRIDGNFEIGFNKETLRELKACTLEANSNLDKVRDGNVIIIVTEEFDYIVYNYKDQTWVNVIYRQKDSKVIATSIKVLFSKAVDLFYGEYNAMFKE